MTYLLLLLEKKITVTSFFPIKSYDVESLRKPQYNYHISILLMLHYI